MAVAPGGASRSARRRRPLDVFAEHLRRNPERNPAILLPRSAVTLARAGFLLQRLFSRGWSLAWLAGFLFAEFLLVTRLAAVGDRWSGAASVDPAGRARRSAAGEIAWVVFALAVFYTVGDQLDADTGALGPGRSAPADADAQPGGGAAPGLDALAALWRQPAWPVLAYLGSFLLEFAVELFQARTRRQPFLPASTLTAAFFFVGAVLSLFPVLLLGGLLGESALRGLTAILLVASRAGADLAVLWLPHWGHRLPGRPPGGPPGA